MTSVMHGVIRHPILKALENSIAACKQDANANNAAGEAVSSPAPIHLPWIDWNDDQLSAAKPGGAFRHEPLNETDPTHALVIEVGYS